MSKYKDGIDGSVVDQRPFSDPLGSGITTATLVRFTRSGTPLVNVPGHPARRQVPARSCVRLSPCDAGKQVVVALDSRTPEGPIVLGVIQPADALEALHVTADGREVTVSAQDTITLACGDASITLNRDGKIVIRGAHVISHASGVNRIRGGSVQLN